MMSQFTVTLPTLAVHRDGEPQDRTHGDQEDRKAKAHCNLNTPGGRSSNRRWQEFGRRTWASVLVRTALRQRDGCAVN